jgi:Tol biopolymer transport system component
MNADGSGQLNLTSHPAGDDRPWWSPDGRRIVFESDRTGDWEIYVMNADGSGQANLTNNSATDLQPAWSPAGLRIVF